MKREGPLLLWGEQDGRAKPMVRAPRGGLCGEREASEIKEGKSQGAGQCYGCG